MLANLIFSLVIAPTVGAKCVFEPQERASASSKFLIFVYRIRVAGAHRERVDVPLPTSYKENSAQRWFQ